MEITKVIKLNVQMNDKVIIANSTLYYYDDNTLDVPEFSYDTDFVNDVKLNDSELESYSEMEADFITKNLNTLMFKKQDEYNLIHNTDMDIWEIV